MNFSKTEDKICKLASELFAFDGLQFLGIQDKVKEIGTTELIRLQLESSFLDFTFLTVNDRYIHFEFQSTDKGKADLQRFQVYEVNYSYRTGKEVITYVIYTGGITDSCTEYTSGINVYRVIPIYMSGYDARQMLETVKEKLEAGQSISRADMMALTFAPVMGGDLSPYEKIRDALEIAKEIADDYGRKVEGKFICLCDVYLRLQQNF